MGVSGLTSYISKNVPHIKVKVKILDEIKEFKTKHNKSPIILIDFSVVTHMQSSNYMEILCGSRWQVFIDREKKFLSSLVDAGAKLVFFIEAPTKDNTRESWFIRKTNQYEDYCKAVWAVKQRDENWLIELQHEERLRTPTVHGPFYRQHLKSLGKWKNCYEDVDLEIARYAKENEAFAVFTDDSDFLIFEGDFRMMSYKQIDYGTFETTEIWKDQLREHFGLKSYQMALFSTFCGNDVVDRMQDLKRFHWNLGRDSKFSKIAQKVKEIMPNHQTDRSEVIKKAANLIGVSTEKISASLKQYDLTSNLSPTIKETGFLKKLLDHDEPIMYIALKGYPKRISPYFEDIANPCFKKSQVDLCIWLYRCILGILSQPEVEMATSHPVFTISEGKYREIQVEPEMPPIEIPDLHDLIFRRDAYETTRRELIKWTLQDPALKIDELMEIEQAELIPVILTLNFLVKQAKVPTKIADLLLLMFKKVADSDFPKKISCPELRDFSFEDFQATWLYIITQATMIEFVECIGMKRWKRYLCFDGVLFQHLCVLFADFNDFERKTELLPIENLRKFYIS
ncbi:uncharacterized protein LOC134830626 [Culicoides brevitarsis]|uniref:uncharacterized protein LOC134830626 n=1 Tax=Culicoides brevitarsis TaxID=469753 RepID=UPI00307CC523